MTDQAGPLSARSLTRRSVLRGGAALGLGVAFAAGPATAGRALAARPSGRAIHIADRGHTHYRIYVGAGEDAVVQWAASELSAYLEQITSAVYEVVVSDTPPKQPQLIVVGSNNSIAADLGSDIDYSALSDDGFALRTDGLTALIAGPNSRGALYGVYWVLDRLMGVRWYAADATRVPTSPDLRIPVEQFDGDHVPRFRFRCILAGDADDAAYRQHNLLNGLRDQYWTVPIPDGINTWDHYWPEEVHGTFNSVVTDPAYRYGGQLLAMDPATRAAAAQSLIDLINARIADGQDASTAFYQNDTGWTPDPASQAFADAHGGALSAPMIDMVNDVISRVREQIPNARIDTQAYRFSFDPPTGITVSDNVVLTVAPIAANLASPLFADDNEQVGSTIERWGELAGNIVLWSYLTDFADFLLPVTNWWSAGESVQQLAQVPAVQGYFGEHASGAGAPFEQLHVWMIARLAWDPTLDPDALLREFLDGYYGAAADALYGYMQTLSGAAARVAARQTTRTSIGAADYLDFDTMRQADAFFDQAQAAVAGDPTLTDRLLAVRMSVDYAILVNRAEYAYEAAQEGISWAPDTDDRLDRLAQGLAISGLAKPAGGATPAVLLDRLRLDRVYPAAPPAAAAGLPASDWVDYQDFYLRLAGQATFVEDSAASNGVTARMIGSRVSWWVQFDFSALPEEGEWSVYVALRSDIAAGADPDATALQLGVYPTIGAASRWNYPASLLMDGQYHEIELPGTYHSEDSDRYFFVTGVVNADVPHLYVDRFFAVRA